MNMIERVARAIGKQQGYDNIVNCNAWWGQAKSAIEAMKEPTDFVINQGTLAIVAFEGRENISELVFKTMIEAALKDG